jgi:hypothetical protein
LVHNSESYWNQSGTKEKIDGLFSVGAGSALKAERKIKIRTGVRLSVLVPPVLIWKIIGQLSHIPN